MFEKRLLKLSLAPLLTLALLACAPSSQVTRLQAEIRRLQVSVDELRKREAEMQVRIQELHERAGEAAASEPQAGAEAPLASPTAPQNQEPVEKPPVGASPHEMYNAAFTQYNLDKHPEAIELFRAFLEAFPRHDLADNAQYWIGECLYASGQFEAAVGEFQRVVEEHPRGNKVPDAFVKRGLSLLALERREDAIEALQTVIEAYPKSDAALYARQRLADLQRGKAGAEPRR